MLSPDDLKKTFGNDPNMLNKLQELSKMLETLKDNSEPKELSPEMRKKMLRQKLNSMKLKRMSKSSKQIKKTQLENKYKNQDTSEAIETPEAIESSEAIETPDVVDITDVN